MPFCPKCRYEYRPEISECPDCNERLVSTMPPEPESESPGYTDWIPIARLSSPQDAQILVEALRSKEIPALVKDSSGYLGQIGLSSFASMVGGVATLLVPRDFFDDACREAQVIFGNEWEDVRLDDFNH